MKQIVVASTNPVKIEAARRGFDRLFPGETRTIQGISVPSGVSDQPLSDEETYNGALNRAQAAREATSTAEAWVGIEGGIEEAHHSMFVFAWVIVLAGDKIGKGRTSAFAVPNAVADLVRQGLELGDADDKVFGRSNSKQVNGAVGLLTGDLIDRATYYEQAVILALIPFWNKHLAF